MDPFLFIYSVVISLIAGLCIGKELGSYIVKNFDDYMMNKAI